MRAKLVSVALFCVLLSACRDQTADRALVRAPGQIVVDPLDLDFGDVAIGAKKTRVVEVKNIGIAPIHLCVPKVTSPSCTVPSAMSPELSPFEWPRPDMWWIIEANETRRFTVLFAPVEAAPFAASLSLGHDAPEPPILISLHGAGVTPDVQFSADSFDFGSVPVGRIQTRELAVINRSTIEVALAVKLSTGAAASFGAGDPASATPLSALVIPASSTATMAVWYRPAEEAEHLSQLSLGFCANCEHRVRLSGRGIKPLVRVAPAMVDFGSHSDGSSPSLPLRIDSAGRSPLTISGIELVMGSPREFELMVLTPLPVQLAPGESLEVQVTHHGDSPGIDVGQIEVRSDSWDDPSTPQDEGQLAVGLVGQSVGPDIDVAPLSLDFGTARVGRISERIVSVSNTGNQPLAVSDLAVSGDASFSVVRPALPTALAPGASFLLTLRFAPTAESPAVGQLVVLSNDRDEGAVVVPLHATGGTPQGCALFVAPRAASFGVVEPGRSSTIEVELRSEGTTPCQVSNLTLTGPPEISLAAGQPAMIDIPAGRSARVPVSFVPATSGDQSAVLRLRSTDPSQLDVDVHLSASSARPVIRPLPSAVDFAATIGCRSIVPLSLYGFGGNLQITSIALDPAASREFELSAPATPLTLPANGSVDLELRYRPTDDVEDAGLLYVYYNGSVQPLAVPLHGTPLADLARSDRFTLSAPTAIDLLFVVDNSSSTFQERNAFAQAMAGLFTLTAAVDYRIAVVAADLRSNQAGRFIAAAPPQVGVITPQTPQPADPLRANLIQSGNGSTAFEATFLALSDPLSTGFNAGFLRPEVPLELVYLSDDDDLSTRAVEFYLRYLSDLKRRPDRLAAHAIFGTVSGGCRGNFGSANYGPRYASLVRSLGGVSISICSADWTVVAGQLDTQLLGPPRRWPLSAVPDPTSLEVQLGGASLARLGPNGAEQWRYDPATGALTIAPDVNLTTDPRLDVRYRAACP